MILVYKLANYANITPEDIYSAHSQRFVIDDEQIQAAIERQHREKHFMSQEKRTE